MDLQWILVGEVVATQGNKGEVRVVPHTEFPERFSNMETVRLFRKGTSEPEQICVLEGARLHREFVILKLRSIDSIDQAEALRGMEIKVTQDELVELPAGRYYIFRLIGLEVVTTEGQKLGKVTDVLETGANDVYVVKPYKGVTDQKEILIPVIESVVKEIAPEKGTIVISLMEGLVE